LEDATSNETINHNNTAGYYRCRVYAYSGGGSYRRSYNFCRCV
jgi:hypothetical protein